MEVEHMLVKETDTQNYGRCMSLTAGKVTLLVTLDYPSSTLIAISADLGCT